MFGKNLESACKAHAATKAHRYEAKADELAGDALRFTAGSPEWKDAVAKFTALILLARGDGVELIK